MTAALREAVGGYRIVGYGGGKSGSKSRAPVEAPDSLHSIAYARVLDLISNGEIKGPTHGTGGALRDIYLDGTPVANADGSLNFSDVRIDFRAGTQDQDVIPGFPAAENTIGVGVELTDAQPWTRAVTNLDLSAVRITLAVQGLSQANTTNGDINGYRVEYAIDVATDGGAYDQVLQAAFDGKTTQRYARSHRIELPAAALGWTVRVRRLTPNASSSTIADTTVVDSVTEVIDAKLRYPMSALVGIQINAAQFQAVPGRAYDMSGRIVRVPSNYDAETRTYTGTWNGTFQLAYTDNPAWIFYDIIVSDLYGLRNRVPPDWVDRWTLYQIGRYCDELVPDGRGGQEPRFTCNCYLQTRAGAWKVLQDLASVFRGITYYASGSVVAVGDMPADPVYTYTAANVLDGKFNYSGSARSTRYTVALVSWNDLTDLGRAKVEVVEDQAGIARYGLREVEVTAFGCTSQGQARRLGKWLLLTSRMETRTVSFGVGLDGAIALPGQIIRVADPALAGRRIGGRIRSATDTEIELDAPIDVAPGDRLTVILPNGIAETRTVSNAVGTVLSADTTLFTADTLELTADMVGLPESVTSITVAVPFSQAPAPESVWALESEELSAQTFRVVSVTERDGLAFDITAVQHEPGKYDAIDFGTKIEAPPITVVPPSVQAPPTDVTLSAYYIIAQGIAGHVGVVKWEPADKAVEYEVHWRRDNSEWVNAGRTGSASLEIPNIYAGGYVARVKAFNAMGVPSVWASSTLTTLDGILAPPPVVTQLTTTSLVFGIQVDWGFPAAPSIIERTELWYSTTPSRINAIKLGDFAYPQNTHTLMGLSAGATLYFWARLVDKNGLAGDFFPEANGIQGQASTDASDILDYLTDQITSTQLSQELLDEIESGGGAAVEVEEIKTDLAAMYTIKTQLSVGNRTYLAGIGVGVENNAGIIESQVLIAADRFAVLHPNGVNLTSPFVIQGGQVFINQVVIGTGWITNAMIGDFIQSNNYVAGVSGWRIDKNGTFEINGSVPGQYRTRITNAGGVVYDGAGTMRMRWGGW